jgi:hypothetical protein
MVSIWGRKWTLADKTVYQNGSTDTSLDTPLISLDSTFGLFFKVFLASSCHPTRFFVMILYILQEFLTYSLKILLVSSSKKMDFILSLTRQ